MNAYEQKKMPFPSSLAFVWQRLHDAGKECYAVGGCVRDFLRGVTPDDYDLTTSATPTEVMEIFSDVRTVPTGLAHGTVTVVVDGVPIEVTTFRIDGNYEDCRHPDAVCFTDSFREDCARRDFTVNAMGYSPDKGLVDFFDGLRDLERGIIRTVGDAQKRFEEDALRILRALRFSSTLGFFIDKDTEAAIHLMTPRLAHVANERIYAELSKLLMGKDVFRVLSDYRDVIAFILPELQPALDFNQNNRHHCYDVYMHTVHAVAAIPPTLVLRLAALFHDIGKPGVYSEDENGEGHFYGHAALSAELTERGLRRLRADGDTLRRVVKLVHRHDDVIEETPVAVRRCLSRHGEEYFFDMLALKRADNLAQAPDYSDRQVYLDRLEEMARAELEAKRCLSLQDLAIDGTDAMARGIPKGPLVGEALAYLLDEALAGTVANEKDALLDALDDWKARKT